MKDYWRLTLVTNKAQLPLKDYLRFVELCIKGGITSLQLREKHLPHKELLHFGQSLKELLDSANLPLIINDDVELCLELDASGVHLGQSDNDIVTARQVLGPHKIIGLSVNTLAQIERSNSLPLNYIGLSAIFCTKSKPNVETLWGLDGLRKAAVLATHPIIAIGGIDENNASSVINCGASGIAAIAVFNDAIDPYLKTKHLINIINGAYND